VKTRSTHVGGWRFRLKVLPWAQLFAGGFFVFTLLAAGVLALVIATAGGAR